VNALYKKVLRAYCPKCSDEVSFFYFRLDANIEMVRWEYNCELCKSANVGYLHINFEDI
jgi:Zn finger protein HypA/HybF involved in hydrogenase expression